MRRMTPEDLDILYEDDAVLVCVKPAGTATETRRAGQPDMVSLLRNYRSAKGEPPYIGLIHRLDQPVGGILVFAKDKKSAAALSAQLAGGMFCKVYFAVVCGSMQPQDGQLTDYLLRDARSNTSSVVQKDTAGAKRAQLSYETLAKRADDAGAVQSLVKIRLQTGRHHQIRVQLAHFGAPLAGDTKYGGTPDCAFGLCACALDFVHPVTKKKLHFEITPKQRLFSRFFT